MCRQPDTVRIQNPIYFHGHCTFIQSFSPFFFLLLGCAVFSLSFHDSICTPSVFSTYLRSFPLLAPIPLQSGIQRCLLVGSLCKNFHDSLRGKSLNRRPLRLVPFPRSRLTQVLCPLLFLRHRRLQRLHLLNHQHYHLPLDQPLNLLSYQQIPMDPKNMLSPIIWLATPSHTH